MNKIRYFAGFHLAKFFLEANFSTQRFQKITASVLSEKNER